MHCKILSFREKTINRLTRIEFVPHDNESFVLRGTKDISKFTLTSFVAKFRTIYQQCFEKY